MQIRFLRVECTDCKKEISPSLFDFIPYPSGTVSVDCHSCGNANKLPLHVSFLASVTGIAIAFTATIVFLAPYNPSPWLVALAAVGGALTVSALILALYLQRARYPFAGDAVGR